MPAFKFRRAQAMRQNPTPAEAALWQAIKGKATGFRFRQQAPMWGYIADFYAPSIRLVVEVDGSSHQAHGLAKDQYRDQALQAHGIKTIRFSNAQVLSALPEVLDKIKQFANSQRNSKKATRRHNPARHNRTSEPTAINTP